ncbi:MAG: carboxyl-terminal protease [Osedax symbiont Rs1]|nr:MAG: carboxyl-terminal protease [Osedax symbiont Rs1]
MNKAFSKVLLRPVLVLSAFTFSVMPFVAQPAVAAKIDASTEARERQVEESLPLAEIRRFSEVFDRIKAAYVEPVSDSKLLEDAIRGMLIGLDPHSSYLVEDQFSDLQEQTSGQFSGVGIEISQSEGVIRVITPIDDTPAMRAGIKAGDLIIKIDAKIIQSIGVEKAIGMMRGKPGSEVVLTIVRDSEKAPFDISIERAIIKVTSVRSRTLAEGIGYIRISQFQHRTAEDMKKALDEFQADIPLSGLILDLRNNPGGTLRGAVDVTDAFVSEGMIVSTRGRIANSKMTFEATPKMLVADIPIIVLINSGSASASEIVAGALQDKSRALIMGTTSFGKGSVQTVLQLTGRRGIKLTTARYYTPNGRSIQAKGIIPDIMVEQAKVEPLKRRKLVAEKDLTGHLEADNIDISAVLNSKLIETDFQLYEALNLIKGLIIVNQSRRK